MAHAPDPFYDPFVSRHPLLLALLLLATLRVAYTSAAAPVTVTVDASVRHQTFRGWEVAIQATVRDFLPVLPGYDDLLRQAATDLGITRLKVNVFSGTEGPRGAAARYVQGDLSEREFLKDHAYRIVNDNGNPDVANLEGFDFTLLDWQMGTVVMPMLRDLDDAGHHGELIVQYGDYGASSFEHLSRPREYAEFMQVVFDHLRTTYGVTPAAVDVVNEPDVGNRWGGADIGDAMVAAGRRLEKSGYRPAFMAPSPMDRGRALPMLADMLRAKDAERYIRMVTYHCYADSGRDSLAKIGEVVSRAGVESAQNECWSELNDPEALIADLTVAQVSSWHQATFHGPNGYYSVDAQTGRASLRPKTRLLRQFYKYVRPGAVRVDATATSDAVKAAAFLAPDGAPVVILVSRGPAEANVTGLPEGTYDVSYTTPAAFDVHQPQVRVASGEPLPVSIPSSGVLTVRGLAGHAP